MTGFPKSERDHNMLLGIATLLGRTWPGHPESKPDILGQPTLEDVEAFINYVNSRQTDVEQGVIDAATVPDSVHERKRRAIDYVQLLKLWQWASDLRLDATINEPTKSEVRNEVRKILKRAEAFRDTTAGASQHALEIIERLKPFDAPTPSKM